MELVVVSINKEDVGPSTRSHFRTLLKFQVLSESSFLRRLKVNERPLKRYSTNPTKC